jgi:hypothetical protein
VIRATGDAAALTPAARASVLVDPRLPVRRADDGRPDCRIVRQARHDAALLATAALAVALAAVAIYGSI